jgi:hypothetical protein
MCQFNSWTDVTLFADATLCADGNISAAEAAGRKVTKTKMRSLVQVNLLIDYIVATAFSRSSWVGWKSLLSASE